MASSGTVDGSMMMLSVSPTADAGGAVARGAGAAQGGGRGGGGRRGAGGRAAAGRAQLRGRRAGAHAACT